MKRFRVLRQQFDFRARILEMEIDPTWAPAIKAQWQGNQSSINASLAAEFGPDGIGRKIQNFRELGPYPLSVIAYHNRFLTQARNAFVIGAYYPALTGACSLGERILNHLLLGLRDAFRTSPEYKRVARKDSFDNWEKAISTLEAWGVWAPEVAARFHALAGMRRRAVHFDPATEDEDRVRALEALLALQEIIKRQFGAFGEHAWFIPDTPGVAFIRKSFETNPFIRLVYVPNAALVGPRHQLEPTPKGWKVIDAEKYPQEEVSDEEFAHLYREATGRAAST